MILKRVLIKNLYHEFSFDWKLNDDVNVLAGINGVYKSTILRIIKGLCGTMSLAGIVPVDEVRLEFTGGVVLKYRRFEDSLLKLKKEARNDEMLNELAEKVSADIKGMEEKSLSDRIMRADIIAIRENDVPVSIGSFRNNIRYDFISTFDVPAENKAAENRTLLDEQLEQLDKQYAYYLAELTKQISVKVLENGQVDKDDFKAVYAQNTLFVSSLNEAIATTGKRIDTSHNKLQFVLPDDQTIGYEKLSSGEKQLLIILLTVLLQQQKQAILIMDEPEISLHFEWQRTLIDKIRTLNPNCQLVMSSHSPALIMNGWEEMVTNMDEIRL